MKCPRGEPAPAPHRQVWIRHGEREASVDKRMTALMLECWKRDISAINCCEGDATRDGYVTFQTANDAIAFLNASVYAKSDSYPFPYTRRTCPITADAFDDSVAGDPAAFELTVTIRFSRRDIPGMVRALCRPARPLEAVSLAVPPVDGAPPPAAEK